MNLLIFLQKFRAYFFSCYLKKQTNKQTSKQKDNKNKYAKYAHISSTDWAIFFPDLFLNLHPHAILGDDVYVNSEDDNTTQVEVEFTGFSGFLIQLL